mmetsp:Transcript_40897/g.89503  ORF Transcript_40897/g.89503 Transcript_40897/m.89503 type:complete len:80 (+) Transcript_40897:112-351(+)
MTDRVARLAGQARKVAAEISAMREEIARCPDDALRSSVALRENVAALLTEAIDMAELLDGSTHQQERQPGATRTFVAAD